MTWLRTYVYFPLGGSRCSRLRNAFNVMVVFTLSGLWHGAAWTYILWGMACGLLLLPHVFFKTKNPTGEATWCDLHRCLGVFLLFSITFLIFRANNLTHLGEMCHALVYGSWTAVPQGITGLCYMIPLAVADWMGRHQEFPLEKMVMPVWTRWTIYWTLLGLIAYYSTGQQTSYIYFQF